VILVQLYLFGQWSVVFGPASDPHSAVLIRSVVSCLCGPAADPRSAVLIRSVVCVVRQLILVRLYLFGQLSVWSGRRSSFGCTCSVSCLCGPSGDPRSAVLVRSVVCVVRQAILVRLYLFGQLSVWSGR